MDEVEAGEAFSLATAQAWAGGDVARVLQDPRANHACLLILPTAPEMIRDAHAHEAAAIERALKTPGHAVAALPLRALVAEDGVLAQLKAKGFTVSAQAGGQ